MTRGTRTREHIIEKAAALFNRKGFAGASVSDIMQATGLKKGGIYRHFESKEALAVEAFDFSIRQMADRFVLALEGKERARERLSAILEVYSRVPAEPPVPGGCPILNASVEHDDGNPLLRAHARDAMDGLRRLIRHTLRRGVERGEVRPGVEVEGVASMIVASLEGGVMLACLYDDPRQMEQVVGHLRHYLEQTVYTA
jgi:TetR/AcrR family transcriptional regulator, transcriptional repressor for nem operon